MSEKRPAVLLSSVIAFQDKKGINKAYIDIIIEEEIPVICINESLKKKRIMLFKALYDNNSSFWQLKSGWEYFLSEESVEKIKEKAIEKTGAWEPDRTRAPQIQGSSGRAAEKTESSDDDLEELEEDTGFGNEYKAIANLSTAEKIEKLIKNKKRLNDLIVSKSKDKEVVTEALVDTTKEAALINHAALEQAIHLADDEAKRFTQGFVENTSDMVKTSAQLFSDNVFSDELMNTLVEKSNGTIVQHMTRVYLNGIAFLSYYNNLVSTSSAIQKLRISFAEKYRKYYKALLPHIPEDDIGLERVFYGGMRAIPPDLYYKWAVGFLIHDIGKAAAVEYHEGEAKYDRSIVIEHVKTGYKSIMTKTSYPTEASLITGYHHEYYGDSAGYGYFRAYLQQYKRQNPDAKQDYIISYELEPMMDYKALAYFPAKVLEIIDVYDSVTDPKRIYRKPMTPEEALAMMREEFIEKNKKIDLILFDIYDAFIREKENKKKKPG